MNENKRRHSPTYERIMKERRRKKRMYRRIRNFFLMILFIVLFIGSITTFENQKENGKFRQQIEEQQETIALQQEKIRQQEKELDELLEEVNRVKEENQKLQFFSMVATGYCACEQCCDKEDGITASGKKAQANHTVAMPEGFSFGTMVEIDGMGIYTVEDRGGAIKGNRIDIYFDSHEEALEFGIKDIRIRIIQ